MELPILLAAVTLVVFLIVSVPIGVAIGSSVVVALLAGDLPPEFLMQKLFFSLDSFPLLAVPFFILSGEIMQKGSMAQSLLSFSKCLVGHITGGLAHVSILTCMFYGALSGSAPATVAAVGGIMIPAMEREGYKKDFSSAVNTAGGCLGVMIPPSVPLIIYGTTANVSVGDLFICGIFPGIFIGLLLMAVSYLIAKRTQPVNRAERASWRETLRAFSHAKYALVVPVIVLGGIYGGITTPTEAGAIAVVYAFVTEGLILKTLTWKSIRDIFRSSSLPGQALSIQPVQRPASTVLPDRTQPPAPADTDDELLQVPLRQSLQELESRILRTAFRKLGSSRKVARVLGIDQSTALRKAHKLGLDKKDNERVP